MWIVSSAGKKCRTSCSSSSSCVCLRKAVIAKANQSVQANDEMSIRPSVGPSRWGFQVTVSVGHLQSSAATCGVWQPVPVGFSVCSLLCLLPSPALFCGCESGRRGRGAPVFPSPPDNQAASRLTGKESCEEVSEICPYIVTLDAAPTF
jgi:hypothetical protein